MEKKIGRDPSRDEVLSYLMYPDVFVKFAHIQQTWGDVDVLPTPQFYYGMERASEVNVELEPGKSLVIKFLTVGEPHHDGTRTVFFELNGQPREVTVRDRKLEAKAPVRHKADPEQSGTDRCAHPRSGFNRGNRTEPENRKGRPPAGDGGYEDAEHRLFARGGNGKAGAREGRPACGIQRPATRH